MRERRSSWLSRNTTKCTRVAKSAAFVGSARQRNAVPQCLRQPLSQTLLWQMLSDLLLQQTGRQVIVHGLMKDMNVKNKKKKKVTMVAEIYTMHGLHSYL